MSKAMINADSLGLALQKALGMEGLRLRRIVIDIRQNELARVFVETVELGEHLGDILPTLISEHRDRFADRQKNDADLA